MKNDTIFRVDEKDIIVMDEKDTSTCCKKDDRDNYQTTWYRYGTGFIDGIPTLTKTYIEDGLDNKTVTYFFHEKKNGQTSIHNSRRPSLYSKNHKHFDLMGRPAKGKHTIDLLNNHPLKKCLDFDEIKVLFYMSTTINPACLSIVLQSQP